MSAQINLDQTHLPLIKQHAHERWQQRTPASVPLQDAWRAAKPVEAPAADCDYARLYNPHNALIIVRDEWLRTVLINDGRVKRGGLVMCGCCDDLVDPISDRVCSYCGEPQPNEQTCGQVTVIHGGSR